MKPDTKPHKKFVLRLPAETLRKLDALAKRQRRTRTSQTNIILEQALGQ